MSEAVPGCIESDLRDLAEDPDSSDLLDRVIQGYEGVVDTDDVSSLSQFRCREAGCTAVVSCVQWYNEETDESGTNISVLSGQCATK